MAPPRQEATAVLSASAVASPFSAVGASAAGAGASAEEERASLSTLTAMFGPRWSETELRGVLRSCGGDAGRAVEAVLSHEAAGRQDERGPSPALARASFAAAGGGGGGGAAAAGASSELSQTWHGGGGGGGADACRGSLLDDDLDDGENEALRRVVGAGSGASAAPLPPSLNRSGTVADSARIMEVCESRVRQFRGLVREHGGDGANGNGGLGGHGHHGHGVSSHYDMTMQMQMGTTSASRPRGGCGGGPIPAGSAASAAASSRDSFDVSAPGSLEAKKKSYKDPKSQDKAEEYSYEIDDYEEEVDDYDYYEERELNKARLGALLTMPTKDVHRSASCNGFSVCSSLSSGTRYGDHTTTSGSGTHTGSGLSGSGSSPQHSANFLSVTSGSGPSGGLLRGTTTEHRRSFSDPTSTQSSSSPPHHVHHHGVDAAAAGCASRQAAACGSPGGCGSGSGSGSGSGKSGGTGTNSGSLYPDLPGLGGAPPATAEAAAPAAAASAGSKVSFHPSATAATAQHHPLFRTLLHHDGGDADGLPMMREEDLRLGGNANAAGAAAAAAAVEGPASRPSPPASAAAAAAPPPSMPSPSSAAALGSNDNSDAAASFEASRDPLLEILGRPASSPSDAVAVAAAAGNANLPSSPSRCRAPIGRSRSTLDAPHALSQRKSPLEKPGFLERRTMSAPLTDDDVKKAPAAAAVLPGAVHRNGHDQACCADPLLEKALRLSMAESDEQQQHDESVNCPPNDNADDDDFARALEMSKRTARGDDILRDDDDFARALEMSKRTARGDDLLRDDDDFHRALEMSRRTGERELLRGDDDLESALELSRRTTVSTSHGRPVSASGDRKAPAASAEAATPPGHDSAGDLARALRLSRQESLAEARKGPSLAQNDDDQQLAMVLELSRKESLGMIPPGAGGGVHDDFLNQVLPNSLAEAPFRGDDAEMAEPSAAHHIPQPTGLAKQRQSSSGSASAQSMDEGSIHQSGSTIVRGAGEDTVNGRYLATGRCNGTATYTKAGSWEGRPVTFTLYRCLLAPGGGGGGDAQRRWFVSIVPEDVKPGTDEDRDFYVAPGSGERGERPPEGGWVALAPFGRHPAPSCEHEGGVAQQAAPPSAAAMLPSSVSPAPTNGKRRMSPPSVPQAFVIESAGRKEVVGTYERTGTHNGAGLFTKPLGMGGARLSVFRSGVVRAGLSRWFLSVVPEGCCPGSVGDTDLYVANSVSILAGTQAQQEEMPPQKGWKAIPGFGLNPPPLCRLESILEDNEDEPQPLGTIAAAAADREPERPLSTLPDLDVSSSPPPPLTTRCCSVKGDDCPSEYECASVGMSCNTTSTPWIPVTDPMKGGETKTRRVAMCTVCRARPVTHVLIPCGHPCLCAGCASDDGLASMRGLCPLARCEFSSVMRFFGTVVED